MTQPSLLVTAIRSERAGIQALVDVLSEERNALREGHLDRLAQFAPRKRELLLHIAHLGEQRNRLLERSGVSADRRGMETWLTMHDADGAVRADWQALLELTQSAHSLNKENGVYIDAGMRANQQSLQALMSAGAATSTYGPGGRSVSPLGSRSLASA
jgi:flagellar biosynthesis/type III secretory pathway chaperone